MKHDKARDIVRELVKDADVIVNNFRPGVMERMGLGYDDLKAINPRIVFAFGTGFGKSGPLRAQRRPRRPRPSAHRA